MSAAPTVIPLTATQQGIVVHSDWEGSGPAAERGGSSGTTTTDPYVAQLSLDLHGPVDVRRLQQACRAVWDVLPNVRVFLNATDARQPVLVDSGPQDPEFATLTAPAGAADEAFDRFAAGERQRPFDLGAGRLVRFGLVSAASVHRLTITTHHLVLDGWSVGRLLALVLDHYATGHLRTPPPFSRYLRWVLAQDVGASVQVHADVLRGVRHGSSLSALTPPGHQPADDPAHGAPGGRRRRTAVVDAGALRELTERCASASATLAAGVEVAWGHAVASATGRRDAVFGTVSAGRPADVPEVGDMVGMFVTTLVQRVRTGIRVDAALREVVGARAATAALPPVSSTAVEEALGVGTLFDTLVVVNNQPRLPLGALPTATGVRVLGVHSHQHSHYPVVCSVEPAEDGSAVLSVEHDPAAVPTAVVDRLFEDTRAALTSALRSLSRGGQTEADVSPAPVSCTPLWCQVDEQAARRSEAVAVRSTSDGDVTYAQLVAAARRWAGTLSAAGVRRGDAVGVHLQPSVTFLAASLGVWRLGACTVPLDPHHPPARTQQMCRTAGVRAVVSEAGELLTLPPGVVRVGPEAVVDPPPGPDVYADGAELAYIIFTSGSTGEPKAVAVTLAALATHLRALAPVLGLGEDDTVLWRTSPSFDASVWECWLPLVTGATVRVAPSDAATDPAVLRSALEVGDVSVVQFVPTVLRAVLDAGTGTTGGWSGSGSWRLPSSVRLVVSGGEALTIGLATAVRRAGDARLINLYGPTETTVQVTWHDVYSPRPGQITPASRSGVPVGTAFPGSEVLVVSPELAPVGPGLVGEVVVGGAQLARGYVGAPGTTASAFVPAPGGPAGARCYRTGDLGHFDKAGALVLLGRSDRQVAVRGHRIEPAEVEAAVRAVPDVQDCLAITRRAPSGDGQLIAFLTGRADPDRVREHLLQRLPSHLVPALLVPVERFPVLHSGKMDTAALLRLAAAQQPRVDDGAGNSHAVLLADIVADVLGLDQQSPETRVGVNDDFFGLGGDSISAITLTARARSRSIPLTPRTVFEERTAAAMAAAALGRLGAPVDGTGEVPLSPFIREHLLRRSTRPDRPVFQALVLRCPPRLTPTLARQVLADLRRRHDLLRARLDDTSPDPANWCLIVPPPATADDGVDVLDVVELPAAASAVDMRAHVTTAISRCAAQLDAVAGNLVRAQLLIADPRPNTETDTGPLLVLVVHHLAVDAVGLRILVDDLEALYAERLHPAAESGTQLPPVAGSYRQWVQRFPTSGTSVEEVRAHWVPELVRRRTLAEASLPAVDRSDLRAGRRDLVLDERTTAQLRETTEILAVPVDAVLVGGLAVAIQRSALARGAGTLPEVAVDVERHGRDLFDREPDDVDGADLSGTLGWFTACHPVPVDLTGLRLGTGWTRTADLHTLMRRSARVMSTAAEEALPLERARASLLAERPPPSGVVPAVLINHLGIFDADRGRGRPGWSVVADPSAGGEPERHEEPAGLAPPPSHAVQVDVAFWRRGAALQLRATWSWEQGFGRVAAELGELWRTALDDLVDSLSSGLASSSGPDIASVPGGNGTMRDDELENFEINGGLS